MLGDARLARRRIFVMINRVSAILLAIGLFAGSAHAADTRTAPPPPPPSPDSFVGGLAMPDRERALIAIFGETARRYQVAHTAAQKSELRIAMEGRIATFMDASQDAKDWLGIVRATHSTTEGDRWVSIEIAPELALSTFENRFSDKEELTLIRKYTPLWHAVDQLVVGQAVKFSATMLILDIADNDGIVLRPHIIARFSSLKLVE